MRGSAGGIFWYQEFFAMDKVMAVILTIGVLGYIFDTLLRHLQARITRWSPDSAVDRMTDARQRRWLPLAVLHGVAASSGRAGGAPFRAAHALSVSDRRASTPRCARSSDGTLLAATSGSLQRVLLGFAIGAACGIPLGLLMGFAAAGRIARCARIVDSLRSIAPIAWIPMALLWLGIRGNAALFIVAYAAFFPFVVNAAQARAAHRPQPRQRGARARRRAAR